MADSLRSVSISGLCAIRCFHAEMKRGCVRVVLVNQCEDCDKAMGVYGSCDGINQNF